MVSWKVSSPFTQKMLKPEICHCSLEHAESRENLSWKKRKGSIYMSVPNLIALKKELQEIANRENDSYEVAMETSNSGDTYFIAFDHGESELAKKLLSEYF